MNTKLLIAFWLMTPTPLMLAEPSTAEPVGGVEYVAGPLNAQGHFKLNKTDDRLALSAIACAGSACVVGFDEGRSARYVKLTQTEYVVRPEPLLLRDGKPDDELDIEAAAIGDGKLFMFSSHAKARKLVKKTNKDYDSIADDLDEQKCKPHPSAIGVYRFAIDASTGLPAQTAKPEDPDGQPFIKLVNRAGLKEAPLEGADGRCLVLGKGLDVEGLAFSGGKLFVGLRGPKPSGDAAYVLAVDANALFSGADPEPTIHKIAIGEGRAIRDMHKVDDGFLILAGPDDIEDNKAKAFSIVHWDGDKTVRDLGALPLDGKKRTDSLGGCLDETVKPEALAVTEKLANGWRIVVLADGLCDGGPMWFEVKR